MGFVVGVAGPAGSGKSTLVRMLLQELDEATALHMDDYQRITNRPIAEIVRWMEQGADFGALEVPLAGAHLERLKRGEDLVDPLTLRRVAARPVILFETHFGRSHTDTGRHIDLLVWIDTPADVALARNVRDFLQPMLQGQVAPDRARVAAIDAYLVSYVDNVRKLLALQQRLIGEDADLRVDGTLDPAQLAESLAREIRGRRQP